MPKHESAWMAEMAAQIGHLSLREVAFPGSHASASSMLATMGDFAPDVRVFASGVFRTDVWEKIVPQVLPWARTQRAGIREQLEAGIRYFDLRVWHNGGETVVCHAVRGAPVTRVIDEVGAFLFTPGHEREIVVLDFHALYELTVEAHEKIVWHLYTVLGPLLVPRTRTADATLEELWQAGQQVIVLYAEDAIVDATDLLWPRERIREARPAARDTAALKRPLARALDGWRDENRFRLLQVALTPDEKMIAAALAGGGPISLAEATRDAAEELERWLRDEWANRRVNIVTADFVAGDAESPALLPRFAAIVRALNQPFHATSRILPCRAGDAHYALCYEPASGDVAVSRLDADGHARPASAPKPRAWAPGREVLPFALDGEALFFQYDPGTGGASIAALKEHGAGTTMTWDSEGAALRPGMQNVAYAIGGVPFVLSYAPWGEHAGLAQIRRLARDGLHLTWESRTWWSEMQLLSWRHGDETYVLQYGYEGEHAGATNLYRMREGGVEWTWGVPSRTWRDRLTIVPCVPASTAERVMLLHYAPDTGRAGLHAVLPGGVATEPLWPEGQDPDVAPIDWAPGLTVLSYRLGAAQFFFQYQAQTGAVAIDRIVGGGIATERTFEEPAGAWRTGLDLTLVPMHPDRVLLIHRRRETGEAGIEEMNPGGLGTTTIWR